MKLCSLVLVALVAGTWARPDYQDLLPNGKWVSHPCKANFMWRGVGHTNPRGGGDLNAFGRQFTNDKNWQTICRLDADGDGLTNGQELGDPDCVWQPGQTPQRVTNITHPGVCDPWNSPRCQSANAWVDCGAGEFRCDAIQESHVRNITLKFPRSQVPAKDTSYVCMNFDLPVDGDFHLIATEPVIDNDIVMHHIAVFGCENPDAVDTSGGLYECMSGMPGCTQGLGVWTVGLAGECLHREAGFRIGNHSSAFKKVAVQFHWTNYNRREDLWDGSGIKLYYTPQRRANDAGVLATGELNLIIPPGRPSISFTQTCPSSCTSRFVTKPAKLFSGLSHMHYLGTSENVVRYRNGQLLDTILDDPNYGYDTPVVHLYDPPIELLPGDELVTTCTFQSMSNRHTVYFGSGTYDEMCFAQFQYYPKDALTMNSCVSYGDFDFCNGFGDCDLAAIFNMSHPQTVTMRNTLLQSCSYKGHCNEECPAAIAALQEQSSCLRGSLGDFIISQLAGLSSIEALQFSTAFTSCSCPTPSAQSSPSGSSDTNAAPSVRALPSTIAAFVVLVATAVRGQ